MKIKKYIAEIIKKYIDIDRNEIEEMIEVPPRLEMGDYSLQCFKLSNILNKSPNIIAKEIKLSLDNNNFEKVEIVGGYLNFFLNKSFVLENTLMEIISENNIANNNGIKNNKVICIDYSYCNKCDKMEFGELFTALIGNSLYKLLKKQGYLVYRIRTLRDNNYKNKESEDIYYWYRIGYSISSKEPDKVLDILIKLHEDIAIEVFKQNEIKKNKTSKRLINRHNALKKSTEK